MALAEEFLALTEADARAALAAEWASASPSTPAEIAEFYRTSRALADDLEAWHQGAARREFTEMVVYVAKQIGAKSTVDIGCGRGDDLQALIDGAGLSVEGVEPNAHLRAGLELLYGRAFIHADVADCKAIETADLLVCIDVLEHIPDPEAWLGKIARRARLGAVLVETCATFDIATPLHLEANRGWHPGHCLELAGWTKIDQRDRVRVWQRVQEAMPEHTSLLLCAYRAVSVPTMQSILQLGGTGWRIMPKVGDALISRARSQVVHTWHVETASDIWLMVDDDVVFTPADAEKVVALAREKRSIACAAYPVADGSYTAVRSLNRAPLEFGPELPPVPVEFGATGFLACHRDVIDALAPTLPLCHADESWAFRYYFQPMVAPLISQSGQDVLAALSEDWSLCLRARELGFTIWMDPTIRLSHLKQIPITVANMNTVKEILYGDGAR